MKKELTSIDKNGEELTKDICCVLQFIYSARFMENSIIFLKEFIKLNVNLDIMIKNVKLVEWI